MSWEALVGALLVKGKKEASHSSSKRKRKRMITPDEVVLSCLRSQGSRLRHISIQNWDLYNCKRNIFPFPPFFCMINIVTIINMDLLSHLNSSN